MSIAHHHADCPPTGSYNPPEEYLFTPEEQAAWEQMDPSDRPSNFVPQKFAALRHVPLYNDLIKERFERCLDLYLCPREIKQKLQIDPDSLLPQLPKPAELRPFPERHSFSFNGHSGRVYSLSVAPAHLLAESVLLRGWRALRSLIWGAHNISVARSSGFIIRRMATHSVCRWHRPFVGSFHSALRTHLEYGNGSEVHSFLPSNRGRYGSHGRRPACATNDPWVCWWPTGRQSKSFTKRCRPLSQISRVVQHRCIAPSAGSYVAGDLCLICPILPCSNLDNC